MEFLSPTQVYKLKKEFEKLDTDSSGFLEYDELIQAVKDAGMDYTEDEIKKITPCILPAGHV